MVTTETRSAGRKDLLISPHGGSDQAQHCPLIQGGDAMGVMFQCAAPRFLQRSAWTLRRRAPPGPRSPMRSFLPAEASRLLTSKTWLVAEPR